MVTGGGCGCRMNSKNNKWKIKPKKKMENVLMNILVSTLGVCVYVHLYVYVVFRHIFIFRIMGKYYKIVFLNNSAAFIFDIVSAKWIKYRNKKIPEQREISIRADSRIRLTIMNMSKESWLMLITVISNERCIHRIHIHHLIYIWIL